MAGNKILGKITGIKIDGNEIDFQQHSLDESFNVIDVTDSSTAGDGTETIVGRATRELKIEGLIKVGGVAQKGSAMNLNFASANYTVTDIKYSETYEEIDVTDSGTAEDSTEFEAGFAERKVSVDYWSKDTQKSIQRGSAEAAVITLAPGVTISGNLRFESLNMQDEVKGAVKESVSGTFQGAVTEAPNPIGGIAMITKLPVVLTYKQGASDKQISGTASVFSREITGNINGELKISWGLKFSGAITETVYSAT